MIMKQEQENFKLQDGQTQSFHADAVIDNHIAHCRHTSIHQSHLPEERRLSIRLKGKRPVYPTSTSSDVQVDKESDRNIFKQGDMKRKRKRHGCPLKSSKTLKISSSFERIQHLKLGKSRKSKGTEVNMKISKEFFPGSFVIIKTDFHATITPPIWRIDGKALLQKYVHFDQEGETLYKNTSTYSGWTQSCKDQYYPADVELVAQSRKETIVKYQRKNIVENDSD